MQDTGTVVPDATSSDGDCSAFLLPGQERPENLSRVSGTVKVVAADSKYRRVYFEPAATSRYSSFFDDIDESNATLAGSPHMVEILSTKNPPPPNVAYVIPYYEWSSAKEDADGADPSGPFDKSKKNGKQKKAFVRQRRMGLRVFLERPWFASGDDELLGVIVQQPSQPDIKNEITSKKSVSISNAGLTDFRFAGKLTLWGGDPIWNAPSSVNGMPALAGWADAKPWNYPQSVFDAPATEDLRFRPSEVGACGWNLQIPGFDSSVQIAVVGYRPEFDEDRGVWFCDIPFDQAPCYGAFVRLALVRYQPHSVPGKEISDVVLSEFALLNPDRVVRITNQTPRSFEVDLCGIANPGFHQAASTAGAVPSVPKIDLGNEYTVSLERRDYNDEGDMGWRQVGNPIRCSTTSLPPGVLCRATVNMDTYCRERRLVVREYEKYLADFATADHDNNGMDLCKRLVYVDVLEFT